MTDIAVGRGFQMGSKPVGSSLLSVLDLATRLVFVPCYLLAAWLSVALVRWRRARRRNEQPSEEDLFPDPLDLDVPAPALEKDEWPSVSVVVPVLNGEKVLGRCLRSIRALDYPRDRLEIIVADNGSTDQTPSVARSFGAGVVVQPKRGAAAARNAAIAAAHGDWIATTDADCVVHPLWVKHLVAIALHEKCAAVGGRVVSVCNDPIALEFRRRERVPDQQASVEGRMLPFPFVDTSNGLFRRDALLSAGGFDEEFGAAAAEDVDLSWRLGECGCGMAYAHDAVVFHRQRERGVDIFEQFYRYGTSEIRLYLKHRHRFSASDLAKHLWIRPVLYRHFWEAVLRWATARGYGERRLWRLVVLKELGHMAGKLEANRRWRTWRHLRLWTNE